MPYQGNKRPNYGRCGDCDYHGRIRFSLRAKCMKTLFSILIALLLAGCEPADDEQQLLEQAIQAHGGYDKLKVASTWIADIRRYQRGDSYVMTNYYRPGMVRLEQDIGEGKKSADVIGHPHCWGKHGPVIIACSAETRENDRPRVVMEMAAQLWPLQGPDWNLIGRSEEMADNGLKVDVLEALYLPLDSKTTIRFDQETHLLHSMSIDGVKGGEKGTHTHRFSDFDERCGVMMANHNVKSFEGQVWVEEDVLNLECGTVDESMFIRPAQVEEGHAEIQQEEEQALACIDDGGTRDELVHAADVAGVDIMGGWQTHLLSDERSRLCVAVPADTSSTTAGLIIRQSPASDYLSIYSLNSSRENVASLVETLQAEAAQSKHDIRWPIRVMVFDNDGMGLTGESIVQASAAIIRK